ncbi:T9SS type A sorting domain-containing protein [Bizionia sediminis]|uniref:T9SS type A sorting domain-containing protein n=1 Tax=Bizionia sediminis TaxID=1737064 RepID=A0ABW5KUC9_9FLAO
MKKIYFLLFSLLISGSMLGQGLEDFTNLNVGTSYSTDSFVGNNNITWSYVSSRDDNGQAPNPPALMLRRQSSGSTLTSSQIPGGIGNFSMKLYKGFTGAGDRQVELYINNVFIGSSTPFDNTEEQTFAISNINVSGPFVMEIRNVTSKQIILDDISWTGFSSTCGVNLGTATYSCNSNTVGSNNDGITVSVPYTGVDANITNVTTTSAGVVGGDNPATVADGVITITGLTEGDAWDLNLVGGDCGAITTSDVITETQCDPVITVNNFLDPLNYTVGNGPSNEDTFSVAGVFLFSDVVITAPTNFEVSLTSGGAFSQSVSITPGALGVVPPTTVYVRLAAGLGINSYSGDLTVASTFATTRTLSLTGNVFGPPTNALVLVGVYDGPLPNGTPKGIELVALADISDLSVFGISSVSNGGGSSAGTVEYNFPADAVSAGDRIFLATEAVNFEAFFGFAPTYTSGIVGINGNDSIELYEGVTIIDTFGDVDVDGFGEAWEYTDGWAYRVSNTGPDGTFVLANWTFSGADALDGETTNATAVTPYPIDQYTNEVLSTSTVNTAAFSIYPNPTSNGFVNITSPASEAISVTIFDVLGKQVLSTTLTNNRLNVSSLNTGMYIVKIAQNGNTVTKKLVIK